MNNHTEGKILMYRTLSLAKLTTLGSLLNEKRRHIAMPLTVALMLVTMTGCAGGARDSAVRQARGNTYYLDGAGGGGLITNWGSGVWRGLDDAGYDGASEAFRWQTGMGVVADQASTVDYKRSKAGELARKIEAFKVEQPNAPVNIIALSAGTAVAVYALEAMRPSISVNNVILLSGSLSSDHDLTRALERVSGKMYIFTSQRDGVLRFLVPIAGTADRESAKAGTIGVEGVRMPRGASARTRELYQKVVVVPYTARFAQYGNYGKHTDSVKAPFVQEFVAPLVMTQAGRETAVASAAGHVLNPDYRRWARFSPGSWVIFEGRQTIDGHETPIRIRVALVDRDPDELVVERSYLGSVPVEEAVLSRRLVIAAKIDPSAHPALHADSKTTKGSTESLTIGGKRFACASEVIESPAEFEIWGKRPRIQVLVSPDMPGGLVRIELKSTLDGRSVELSGTVVEYHIAR